MSEQLIIPGTPPPPPPAPVYCTLPAYRTRCEERWHGPALQDAWANWHAFEEIKPALTEALAAFHRDPFLADPTGKCHNPDGNLTALLWKLQGALNPDPHSLHPLLDFEEHYQKIFLRRGLLIYCELILREMERAPECPPLSFLNAEVTNAPSSALKTKSS
jgi:hypothetical protein